MGVVGWILIGLLAGASARALAAGDALGGPAATLLVGTLGAVVGGLVAAWLGLATVGRFFGLWSWLLAAVGGVTLLALVHAVATGGAPRRA